MRSIIRRPVARIVTAPIAGFLLGLAMIMAALVQPVQAADRARLEAFLEVTGFDVALESIRLSADSAPAMLGVDAAAFGSEWQRLVGEVFATDTMHEMALELLGETLSDAQLTHAADFYASDLGRRLVEVENRSHMDDDSDLKRETGAQIIAGLNRIGSDRVATLERLNAASGGEDTSVRSIQEVQVRFLMAAASAGVIELQMDEPDLREAMRAQEPEMRTALKKNALESSASTYQAFSDDEVAAYADALEHPTMQEVYALMNAVQFEIMANRFEAVANRLSGMKPSQEL